MSQPLLDRAGRRRSPATMPGFHTGRPPRNKGLRYPADPPKVEEIVAVMRTAGEGAHARRLRGLIVILWRAGLRIQEALNLAEADLDHRRGALLVRHAPTAPDGAPIKTRHGVSAERDQITRISNTPTSAPPRSTCKASTTPRSSKPPTPAAPR
jgi:integrase